MEMKRFKEFLQEEFSKDTASDNFNEWLGGISIDDWIYYGDMFGVDRAKVTLKASREIIEKV